ncbi:type VI secretion system tip protein VgrG [Acinetobacter seifertii]|uniref:type VI secretion system Vgr family protein n=1 Tax=Acinetobacter seifertii TaxID=1530123 RepID=UPI00168CFC3A|nr:type VI secretion system Vgr family protein [Acinetobacter seifertii]QNW99579.1 type VI secretion system tip protein VgrG [Acinetobacter seifertii]
MFNSIFSILDKLGYGIQKRAISIHFSNMQLNSQIMLQRIDGYHGINEGLSAELICLSTNPYIELKQFIGCQVAIDQITDSGKLFRTTGIITGASQGQSDGAFSLYRLTMQDPTSLWHKRRNSRVFMNKSVVDIVEIIFKEWQTKSSLFAASLKLDTSGLTKSYDIRPFSMQANESDYTYLTRLMREESINWLIDESNYITTNNSGDIESQKLRLIDDNFQFTSHDRRTIRYHRSNATEQYDSITSFIAERHLQPTAIHVQRWQADSLSQQDGSGSIVSSHKHSSQRDNESLSLEQAWSLSPSWISDLKGEDQATVSSNDQLEKLNRHLNQYQALQAKYFTAHSSVRDAQVGYWFQLVEHPELDKNHAENDKEFLILSKHFYNQNNLPKDIQGQVEKLLTQSHWQISQDSEQERQANELIVVRRSIPVVPEYNPLEHRPIAHVQRAKVTTNGEEIHVDEWGRIKVRFLFTRADDHAHDGGAGSNEIDNDSAWVDVLTPWAGEGYGTRFLPRKDEIVVIDFFDGNIDRPFVTGRIHEAQRTPTRFDIKGKLPETKKLSGIRSKEVDGEGYNQLRFDDTTGQISAQLHSSYGATQLNLGNLSHPKETAESDGRGEGFELRTDKWGALRAGKGLLISTAEQANATDVQLNIQNLLSQLSESLNQLQLLEKNARTSKVFQDENYQISLDLINQTEKTLEKFTEPNILMSSVNDLISVSQGNQTHVAKDNIKLIAGKQFDISSSGELTAQSAKGLSLYTQDKGVNLFATKGNIKIHAQNDELELASLKECKIISTENSITLAAKKEIMLTCGGGYIKIKSDGSIEINSPGLVEIKSSQTKFTKGVKHNFPLPNISSKICVSCLLDAARKSLPFVHREI